MDRISQDYLKSFVFPTAKSRLRESLEGTATRKELNTGLGASHVQACHYQDSIAGFGL